MNLIIGIVLCFLGLLLMIWFLKFAGKIAWERPPILNKTVPFLIIFLFWIALIIFGLFYIWQTYPAIATAIIAFIVLLYVRGFFIGREKTRAKRIFQIYNKFKSYPNLSKKELYIKTTRFYYQGMGLDSEEINFKLELIFRENLKKIENVKSLANWIILMESPSMEYNQSFDFDKTFKKMDDRKKAINEAYKIVFGQEKNDTEQREISERETDRR